MMGYEKTKEAVYIALANLDLEYIDLMFLHFPATEGLEKNDPMHVENRHGSWKALEDDPEGCAGAGRQRAWAPHKHSPRRSPRRQKNAQVFSLHLPAEYWLSHSAPDG